MAFQKAIKEKVKLRLALCGLAGSGKTYSALSIATHLVPGGRIAVLDTERGSASLYADKFSFDVCEIDSFSPLSYVERIQEAEREGYDIIIIDSLSHAWAGKDGALRQKDDAAERSGNSWTAWRNVTPKHDALVDAMLQCKSHLIATMRVKMEHVQETVGGKTEIKKVGLASIQREGMEYEFTMVGDVDHSHTLKITKTRIDGIDIGDQFEKPGETFARRLSSWMLSGADPRPRAQPAPEVLSPALDDVFTAYLAGIESAADLVALDRAASAPAKPAKGTAQYDRASAAYQARKAALTNGVAA